MAASEKIASGAGLRHIRYWLLDETGYPDGDQSGANGYGGRRIEGAKTFTTNIPDNVPITHTGDDRVLAQDVLPPTTLEVATLTTSKSNQTVDSELFGHTIQTIGEIQMDAFGTDHAGSERQVALYGWRQALVTDRSSPNYGQRRYITYMYPSARVVPKGGGMGEQQADENAYNVVPTVVKKTPWGVAFTEEDNAYEEATRLRFVSQYPIMMERWTGNNTLDTFTTEFKPISVVKTNVWGDGTELTVESVSTVTPSYTVDAAPGNNVKVMALYECSNMN